MYVVNPTKKENDMQNYINKLSKLAMFDGIGEKCIESLLACCNVKSAVFDKGEVIITSGKIYDEFGILMQGKAKIIEEDFWGNENLISIAKENDTFAEAFSFIPNTQCQVTVIAIEKCEVLFINAKRILETCKNECGIHEKVIKNIMFDFARKTIYLNRKINHLSKRTTKQKIMCFLSDMALESGNTEFCIPFNRQQMADYLSVDRSAMSSELSDLKKQGKLDYRKNRFVLLGGTDL